MMGKGSEVENPSLGQKLGMAVPDRTISTLHLLSIPPDLGAGLCQVLQWLFWFIVSHNTSRQHHFSFSTFHCPFWALSSCGFSSTATCGPSEAGRDLAQVRMDVPQLCQVLTQLCQSLATAAAFGTTL